MSEMAAFEGGGSTDEELWERRMRAMTLRNGGATYRQIGERLGIHPDTARKDVRAMLQELIREPTEDKIAKQMSVLNDLKRAHYGAALQRDKDSTKTIMDVMEHEARLFGLHAPQRIALGITDTEFAEEAVKLIAGLDRAVPDELAAQARVDAENTIEAEVVEVDLAPERPTVDPDSWADI